jgi:hypothetical protein
MQALQNAVAAAMYGAFCALMIYGPAWLKGVWP